MTTISALNSSARDNLTKLLRSDSGADSTVSTAKKAGTESKGSSDPATVVDLSDRAKAMLERNEADRIVADRLDRMLSKSSKASGRSEKVGAPTTVEVIKAMAKSDVFRSATQGKTDDQVRTLVRNGAIPTLPPLTDDQYEQLSEAELNTYQIVSGLQGLFDAQPKSLEDARSKHVSSIIDGYPEMIAREKEGLANGTLPAEDGWEEVIAQHEAVLSAAQQGKMQIHAVDDPGLVRGVETYTMQRDAIGFSGRGQTTIADIGALQSHYGTKNVQPGSGPYSGSYVITW